MDNHEINLKELVGFLLSKYRIILFCSFISAALVTAYTLTLPNVYESQIVLQVVEEDNELSSIQGLASQFGGLASLAGVNLPSSNNDIAKHILKTRQFILGFINKHQIAPELMAVNNWNPVTGSIAYDSDIYDPDSREWTLEKDGKKTPPSAEELFEKFSLNLAVFTDTEAGLVIVSKKHISPTLAKEWLTLMVADLNEQLKKQVIDETSSRIDYLEQQIHKTSVVNIRSIFYQLIEKEYQHKMLAETRDEFAFKVIDPAYVPEKKSSPLRALIAIFAFLMGALFSSIVLLINQTKRNI